MVNCKKSDNYMKTLSCCEAVESVLEYSHSRKRE